MENQREAVIATEEAIHRMTQAFEKSCMKAHRSSSSAPLTPKAKKGTLVLPSSSRSWVALTCLLFKLCRLSIETDQWERP